MIIGAFYPGSPHLGRIDEHGHKIDYTHNLLYLGKNSDGEMIFADQVKFATQVKTLKDWNIEGIEARDIIDVKSDRSVKVDDSDID